MSMNLKQPKKFEIFFCKAIWFYIQMMKVNCTPEWANNWDAKLLKSLKVYRKGGFCL